MRISANGQVTIPLEVLEQGGLLPLMEVDFVVEPDGIRIVRAKNPKGPSRGDLIVRRLRRAQGHVTMTTDEIMALTRGDD